MATILPCHQGCFECVSATPLPRICVPAGTSGILKLYPKKYFSTWDGNVSPAFRTQVLPDLTELCLGEIPEQVVYVWKTTTPVCWRDTYTNFPRHPSRAGEYQVAPFYRLQELITGWPGLASPIVPKTDVGALLWLGNAGIRQPPLQPHLPSENGKLKRLVWISHYVAVSSPQWSLDLPQKETDDWHLCPEGMIFLTVW